MRYAVVILGLVLVVGTLVGIKGAQIGQLIAFGKAAQAGGPPPEAVNTTPAVAQSWEEVLSAVATVTAKESVSLSIEAPGTVTKIHFDSGATAQQGQLLLELDARVERAQIASLRARLKFAGQSLERAQSLVGSGALPRAELDSEQSAFSSLSAEIQALEAQVERKRLRAPFTGKLGVRAVNLGQYLAPGTVVTVLEANAVVFVDFTLPQNDFPRIQIGMPVRVLDTTRAEPLGDGEIIAIAPALDAGTRAFKVRAHLPNDGGRFRSGMFARVEVVLPQKAPVVAVPGTAIVRASYGNSLFIVEPKKDDADQPVQGADGKPALLARQQFVRLGPVRGDFVAIQEGVSAGQEIVTAGAFKLRNGAPIQVKNEVKLDAQLDPKPENR